MKFNFYFIHGWGLDSKFWDPVRTIIQSDQISISTKCLDLSFFSKKKHEYHFTTQNNIFIVHSYGLQWFLKNHLNCKILINFFGVPDFINFQKNPQLISKKIMRMNHLLNKDPNMVLKNFYKRCNLRFKNKKVINTKQLSKALDELINTNYVQRLKELDFQVHSIFSLRDKILNLNKDCLKIVKSKSHNIIFLKDSDHGFPNLQPYLCYQTIKEILKDI